MSLVGVIASTNATTDSGVGGFDPVNGIDALGAAVIQFNYDDDDTDFEKDVAFNSQRLAHELGHCFGLRHDDASAVQAGSMTGQSLPSFMDLPPGPIPILGGTESGTVFIENMSNWKIWATQPWSPVHPRASGFGWTPCIIDADCATQGFPTIICTQSGICNPI